MKTIKYLIAATLVLTAAACTRETQPASDNTASNNPNYLVASHEDNNSKTVLSENGTQVLWSPKDEINVFYGATSLKFTSLNTVPEDVAVFTSEGSIPTSGYDYIWAVYPYDADNVFANNSVTVTVPSAQSGLAGSFSNGSFPVIGRSKTVNMPFYNLCGGIRFSVSQSGIREISFKGNNNELIAGKVKVTFNESEVPVVTEYIDTVRTITLKAPGDGFETGKWYYFSVLPTEFSKGVSFEFAKRSDCSERGTKTSGTAQTIKRSNFGSINNIDSGVEYTVNVTSLVLNPSKATIKPSTQKQLSCTVLPTDATYTSLSWESDNTEIATVDNNGLVTATANEGECNITVTSDNGTKASCKLTVSSYEYTTLASIKEKLGSSSSVVLPAGTQAKVTVISSKTLNNQSSGQNIIVQDETAGIVVRFKASCDYDFGEEYILNLGGQTLQKYSGSFQIYNLPLDSAVFVQSGLTPEPIKISVKDFVANKYESRYVAIDNVQVADSDLGKNWAVSSTHTSIKMVAKTTEEFVVFSSKTSSYAGQSVSQGSGTIKGISSIFNSQIQLTFAQSSDWAGLTGARFVPGKENYFEVSPTAISAKCSDTEASFAVSSDKSWTVQSLTSGFTVTKTSGSGCDSVKVSFAANTDPNNQKIGQIKVSCADLSLEETVTITQAKYSDVSKKKFVKVTSAPTNWSGEYLIGYIKPSSDTVYVFNGEDVSNGYVLAVKSGNVIEYSEALASVTVTVASMTGGYSLKVAKGYMYGTSGSNKLNFNTTTPQVNTIAYDTDNVKITSNTSVLSFNSASGDMRFRYYKAATYTQQKRTQLFKLVED